MYEHRYFLDSSDPGFAVGFQGFCKMSRLYVTTKKPSPRPELPLLDLSLPDAAAEPELALHGGQGASKNMNLNSDKLALGPAQTRPTQLSGHAHSKKSYAAEHAQALARIGEVYTRHYLPVARTPDAGF